MLYCILCSSSLILRYRINRYYYTQPFNGLWSRTTLVGRYQKKHSRTHTHPDHWILYQLPPFTTINGILFVHFTCLKVPLVQPLSRSSLVFLLVLDSQLHTPYISSPNHNLLFAAHAHSKAAVAIITVIISAYLPSLLDAVGWAAGRASGL